MNYSFWKSYWRLCYVERDGYSWFTNVDNGSWMLHAFYTTFANFWKSNRINYDCIQRIILPLLSNFYGRLIYGILCFYCLPTTEIDWACGATQTFWRNVKYSYDISDFTCPNQREWIRSWSFLLTVVRGCCSQPLIQYTRKRSVMLTYLSHFSDLIH